MGYSITKQGEIINSFGKSLKPRLKNGYYQVVLYSNKKPFHKNIHRLVASKYIPNPDNLPCVNHKNGNKLDNRVDNLEWCTYKQNTIHAINLIGAWQKKNRKLNDKQVVFIRDSKLKHRELANMFKVGKTTITQIKQRLYYKEVA